jgi:hypothetical protein
MYFLPLPTVAVAVPDHQPWRRWITKGLAAADSGKINNRINTFMASLAVPKNVYSNSAC